MKPPKPIIKPIKSQISINYARKIRKSNFKIDISPKKVLHFKKIKPMFRPRTSHRTGFLRTFNLRIRSAARSMRQKRAKRKKRTADAKQIKDGFGYNDFRWQP